MIVVLCVWSATNTETCFLHAMQNTVHECTKYEHIIKTVNTLTQDFSYQGEAKSQLETYYLTNVPTVFLSTNCDPAALQ